MEQSKAFNRSKNGVEKNISTWAHNLKRTTKRRPNIPELKETLSLKCRMPLKKDVIGRYLGLYDEVKGKPDRIKIISDELIQLWSNLNFPVTTYQNVRKRVTSVIEWSIQNRKRAKQDFEDKLLDVFDVTKVDGEWFNISEDKKLYELQVQTNCKVGYTTKKIAPISTIHLSRRIRLNSLTSDISQSLNNTILDDEINDSNNDNFESECTSDARPFDELDLDPECDMQDETEYRPYSTGQNRMRSRRAPRGSTKLAVEVVTTNNLSTNKTSNVLTTLAENGINVAAPKQSSIWKEKIKHAVSVKDKLKECILNEEFCLHFDGKQIDRKEFQVVCLTNDRRTLLLGILHCVSGSAQNIFGPLEELLNDYDAWNSIRMIITDTTKVNTGRVGGVVAKLNDKFASKGLRVPQYIGCQHHILDTVLRHVLNSFFPEQSKSPNIHYPFITEIQQQYDNLKNKYPGDEVMPNYVNPGYRDDFKFLYDLCQAYNFYKVQNKWPLVKWYKLPSMHNARWNSRGIYALIAYFLLPKWRESLASACNFIAGGWSKAWFCDQKFSESSYVDLENAINKVPCKKVLVSFQTFWNKNPSVLDVKRSNIAAERGVKVMEEVVSNCKTLKYINSHFIVRNKNL